jgi:hypothetical protein
MAGFDLTCLGSGLFLAWAAWKMRRVEKTAVVARRPISLEREAT